jgi:hypothetical protein
LAAPKTSQTDITESDKTEDEGKDKALLKNISGTSTEDLAKEEKAKLDVETGKVEQAYIDEKLMANSPVMAPISIDTIQKSVGSIANLSQNGIKSVYGFSRSAPTESSMPDLGVLKEVALAVRDLRAKLEEPITAQTYTVGKGGIENNQKLVEKMRRNASRKIN